MTEVDPLYPSLEDLSRAQVNSSRFFGFTNASGKVLSLLSVGTLSGGVTSLAQAMGYLGPVLGVTVPLGLGLAALGGTIAVGLAAYWLGNFDDKRIAAHNDRASGKFNAAREVVRDRIEDGFLKALEKIQYDPTKHSLPYSALGHAVMLSDDKIDRLPHNLRLDIYRTQLDLDSYAHSRLTSRDAVEGQRMAHTIMDLPDACLQADAYKAARDRVRAAIKDGTFRATPASAPAEQVDDSGSSWLTEDVANAFGDLLRAAGRSSGRAGDKSFRGGGGSFGGGGASGSWAAVPVIINTDNSSLSGSFSSASGGESGFKMPDIKVDKDSAQGLVIVAGVAAAVAAFAVCGCAVWKNFVSKPQEPALGNIPLPMITKSLPTAEKQVKDMYDR